MNEKLLYNVFLFVSWDKFLRLFNLLKNKLIQYQEERKQASMDV